MFFNHISSKRGPEAEFPLPMALISPVNFLMKSESWLWGSSSIMSATSRSKRVYRCGWANRVLGSNISTNLWKCSFCSACSKYFKKSLIVSSWTDDSLLPYPSYKSLYLLDKVVSYREYFSPTSLRRTMLLMSEHLSRSRRSTLSRFSLETHTFVMAIFRIC